MIESNKKRIPQIVVLKAICAVFNEQGRAVSLRDIVHASGIPRSSVHKYLSQLISEECVNRVAMGWYTPSSFYQWKIDDYIESEESINGD